MKFTLNWLKTHLDTKASLEEICTKLNQIGFEVEKIINPAEQLAAFYAAKVIALEKHPNADKLKLCIVDTGKEKVQLVCGAPNVRTGMIGVFAPPGAHIPGTGLDLKPAKIRGVDSFGMLCSKHEMMLSDDHDTIIELPEDTAIGTPFAEAYGLDDPVIEIEITPNRPDCLGVCGIARDLAATGLGTFIANTPEIITGEFDSPLTIKLEFDSDTQAACPLFTGCYIKNITNGKSPKWLRERLQAIGLRPINTLVDITNFLTHDRARPLHVYDADKLQGDIRARLGKNGEKFKALDDKDYQIDDTMCVICDDNGVLGLGGIIGGKTSGATGATTNVFIESAYFDPVRTTYTGRTLDIISDARSRFERGVDPAFVEPGLHLAIQMVLELCGGTASKPVIAGAAPQGTKQITFDPAQVKNLGGVKLDDKKIIKILENLGFSLSKSATAYNVTSPSWRPDIEGPADLVEEVIRIYGIDNIEPIALPRLHAIARPVLTQAQRHKSAIRRHLAARGMIEAVTWSFIPEPQAQAFANGITPMQLANPISSEMSHMRPSLLPGLLAAAARNVNQGLDDMALYEVGQQFMEIGGNGPELGKSQCNAASGIRRNRAKISGFGRDWAGTTPPVEAFDAKADALAALAACNAPLDSLQLSRKVPDYYHPGRAGSLYLGPVLLAHFGEIHPRILKLTDVTGPMVGFEVFYENLAPRRQKPTKSKTALEAHALQPVSRDLAFVLDNTIAAETLIRAARDAEKKLISAVKLFDLFEDTSLGENKKSLAIEITLQPRDTTLTDEEIDAIIARIIARVEKATGGALRT